MKKQLMRYFKWSLLGLLAVALIAWFLPWRSGSNAPKFLPTSRPSPGTCCRAIFYPSPLDNPIPFSSGITCVKTFSTTYAGATWLLNVGTGEILGELIDAKPLALDFKNKRLICKATPKPVSPLRRKIHDLIYKLTRLRYETRSDDLYWWLDLENGNATFIGASPPKINWRSMLPMDWTFVPSPDVTRAYQVDSYETPSLTEIVLFDLSEHPSIESRELPGVPDGWWTGQEILCQANGAFQTYNVATRRTSDLFSEAYLRKWLIGNNIQTSLRSLGTFGLWNGGKYDFYFTDLHARDSVKPANSFLAKLNHREPWLTLVAHDFTFGWGGHFNPGMSSYVFGGAPLTGATQSAVFVRGLNAGTEKMIVPPDNLAAYFSGPLFYNDSIVLRRSNMLWKVDVHGSNMVRLFPPP